jgi:hypothetical protein
LTDNEGEKPSFVLNNVNYLLNSPVNLLSLCWLAELYLDSAGYPDRNGTGICSGFDSNTIFWDREKFKKIFQTASLGLPECLFNLGYSRLEMFSTTISNFYNDTINWAFASKEKLHKIANNFDKDGSPITEDDAITYVSENEVLMDVPVTLTNLISFFDGMRLHYNDGNGTRDIVTFVGADFVDDMQIKCKVKLSNDNIILVDPGTLNFIENPDIASIPQTSEEYYQELKNIEPSQLEHLLAPQRLSPLQEEMMSHHYRLHHMHFPKLIVMAEKGIITKCLASLKGHCPICVACLFGQAHKCPWRSKSKQKHPICKPTDDAPGKRASMDMLVSAQPGLIPQMSGSLTNL